MASSYDEVPAGIWAVVPVKPLAQAKTRLSEALTSAAREMLVLRLFEHTLAVLQAVPALAGIMVVTADPHLGLQAQQQGAWWYQEPDVPGLNPSLSRALQVLQAQQAHGALILPMDLPYLNPHSVLQVLTAAPPPPAVVIVADRHHTGTNALLLLPPAVIPPAFGAQSQRAHSALARAANVPLVMLEDEALAADVDLPEDLAALTWMIHETAPSAPW